MLKLFKAILSICIPKKGEPKEQVVTVTRLNNEVYNDLVKKMPNLTIGSETSPTEAAYKLGVARALEVIRQGVVV